jgi:hypothetical protein
MKRLKVAVLTVVSVFVLLSSAATSSASSIRLYATGSGGTSESALYTLDPLTGQATLAWSLSGAFVQGGGLVYDPVTDLLFATGYDDLSRAALFTIDRFTGTTTLVGNPMGAAFEFGGLAEDPTSGILYATGVVGQSSGLFTIDKTTGAATPVGLATGQFTILEGLGFRSDGTLFGNGFSNASSISKLFTVNVATGATTELGPHGVAFGRQLGYSGLVFASDGTLLSLGSHSASSSGLYAVDPGTGAATLIGDTVLRFGEDGGLAYAPDSPVTTSTVPEPATLALLATGIGCLATRRRKGMSEP